MDNDNMQDETVINKNTTTEGTSNTSDTSNTTTTDTAPSTYQWRPQDADKEVYKAYTRERVRNATVPSNAIFRPAKPAPSINDSAPKKVAVYARVSTKSTEQVSSIENQTKYYTDKIEKTPNWEMQDIYKDEGFSGTSTTRRKDFQRMIKDARDKKMDLILCASVSRFARDISDCMEQIRVLTTANPKHPVGVYFETENIYTLEPNIAERLEMHAMFAEWESRNKSRRMILSYDQRICTGQYPVADLLGYRHTVDGDLIIEPEEAKTVRFIFLAYIAGYSYSDIAQILTDKKRPSLTGRTDWNSQRVKDIMYNERRWGDLDARKTICIDYKKRISIKNDGTRNSAYIPEHHQGIVTKSIATAAHMLGKSGKIENGVPCTSVIAEGSLKGFIVISPKWNGIDDATFNLLSRNVYTDDEYENLNKHTILSMTFNGYKVPYGVYFLNNTTPALTISYKTIRFNKACYKRFSETDYIQILYHPILKMIAIRPCQGDAINAVRWRLESGNEKTQINAKAFSKSVYDMTDWIQSYSYKFRGVMRERGNLKIMFFYLDEPQILVDEKTKSKLQVGNDNSDSNVYIPYKNSELSESNTLPTQKRAFPQAWKANYFGIDLNLRKERDILADYITETDMQQDSICVENPLIGVIPSHEEILQELNELLESM